MVYAITVDDFRERITVIFRGSVTTNDFLTDLKSNHRKSKFKMLFIEVPFNVMPYFFTLYCNSDDLTFCLLS